MHWSGVCVPSLKKWLEPSLSYLFLEYAGNWRNLIGLFRSLETKVKTDSLFTENQNPGLVYWLHFLKKFLKLLKVFLIRIIFYI